MEAHKERSRKLAKEKGGAVVLQMGAEETDWLARNGITPTDDAFKHIWHKVTVDTMATHISCLDRLLRACLPFVVVFSDSRAILPTCSCCG